MRAKLPTIGGMGILLVAFGCTTPKPNLKPESMVEVANSPPSERRYDYPAYPKAAFENRDPLKKLYADQDVLPVRGPSMNGMTGPGAIQK